MLIASFILGFTGSLHCVGMCGPIALLVNGKNKDQLLLNRLLYNTGRTFTYAAMGLVVGVMGRVVTLSGMQSTVSIAAGLLIIASLFLPGVQRKFFPALSGMIFRLKSSFSVHLRSHRSISALMTGVLNGFLPCGLVYAALTIALVQESILTSMSAMILFGVGTIPAMLVFVFSFQKVRTLIPWSFQRIQTLMLVIVAILMMSRGIKQEIAQHNSPQEVIVCH